MSDQPKEHIFDAHTPVWAEQEVADGDRICAALGLARTEGGRLPVAKILAAIEELQSERNDAQHAAEAEAKLADERHARQRDAEAALGFLRCHPQSVRAQEYADKVLDATSRPAERWFAASVTVLANILTEMGYKIMPAKLTLEMSAAALADEVPTADMLQHEEREAQLAADYQSMIKAAPPPPFELFDIPFIPRSPQDMIDFIGSHFNMMTDGDEQNNPLPLDMVRYDLTVHDLLSAFSWAGFYDVKLPAPNRAALRERESPSETPRQGT